MRVPLSEFATFSCTSFLFFFFLQGGVRGAIDCARMPANVPGSCVDVSGTTVRTNAGTVCSAPAYSLFIDTIDCPKTLPKVPSVGLPCGVGLAYLNSRHSNGIGGGF